MSGHASTSCPTCGAWFTSPKTMNGHRAGEWGDPVFPRRCRTETEMVAGGMWLTRAGVWHGTWTAEKVGGAWQGRTSGTTGARRERLG